MIPYGRHNINEEDIAAVVEALRSDWLTTGPLVESFENKLKSIIGVPCVSVSSGTAALHCAYAAIGLNINDEVITPPLTFIATQATAALFGAKIKFVDVTPDTGNIDPDKVEAAITEKTKAIVAVDYAGHPADYDELRKLADKYGLFLIADAAHSFGALYRNRWVGSIADITTFSFFPTKNFTTAEGGAIASPNAELLQRARLFSRQGLIRDKSLFHLKNPGPLHQEVHDFGLNYRLPDVLCALGISQLDRFEEFKLERKRVFNEYSKALSGIKGLRLPILKPYVDPMWHLFPVRVPVNKREYIFQKLHTDGFSVRVNYLPANLHPVFKRLGYPDSIYPVAQEFYESEISLPMMASREILDDKFFIDIRKCLVDGLQ